MRGKIAASFAEELPLKGTESGRCGGGKTEKNGYKKRTCSELLQALLSGSLFERHHVRLKSDVIIVSHNNSLYLHYSTPGLVRQGESALFEKNLTWNG